MSAPTPGFGAPSLGPADRNPRLITPPDTSPALPAWDDPAPAEWRAFGEPAPTRKEHQPVNHMNGQMGGHYGTDPIGHGEPINPAPEPTPAPQPAPEQKPEGQE